MSAVGYVVRRIPELSQTFVTNEVDELARQGVDLALVALEPPTPLPSGTPRPDMPNVRAVTLPAEPHGSVLWANLWYASRHPGRYARFRRTARRLRSETGTGTGLVDANRLPLVARWMADREVVALHGVFGWGAAAAAWMLSDLLDVPWSMTLHAKDMFSRLHNLGAKLDAADHIVTVCDYNRRHLRDELGVRKPIHVVVCGVEVPKEPAPPERSIDVVAVGRLVEKKGFDTLIRASAIVRDQRPDLTVEIIGTGPLADELAALRSELGLDDVVRLVGARPHDETLGRIEAARLMALPCRVARDGDRDSMPVVVKEAMARGVAVVSTDAVGVPEMVDETCGRLVPPDDPAALAAAMVELLDDPALSAALGRSGRERVIERFTLPGEVAKLVDLFRSMGVGASPTS
jgi:glycosyltransferase involved in cell wall biosynthesis